MAATKYKVLLVDDDELDLEGMRRFIPWSELGMEVSGTANNAFSACEVIEQSQIDILVSDVNMPSMSGLELARFAIGKNPCIRIIFVSGYQEFSYVQQALSLKAYSYVLKPMDDSELVASLSKVKHDLDEEHSRMEVERAYQHMVPLAKNDLLIRLLDGDMAEEKELRNKLLATHQMDRMEWPVRAAVLELDSLVWMHKENAYSRQELSRTFLYEVNEISKRHGMPHCCKLTPLRIGLIVYEGRMEAYIADIYRAVRSKLPVSMTMGLGEPVYSLDDLPMSYKQAMQAVDGKMFLGKGDLIKYDNVESEPEMLDARTLEIRMNALLAAMTEYELVRIYDELDNLFQTAKLLRSRFTVQNLSIYIILKLDQYLNSHDENLFDLLGLALHNLDILQQFETTSDIRSWLVKHIFQISEHLHLKSSTKNGKFVTSILQYMKEKMSENITLKDVAQQFSFSPNYMGYLIKEKSGCTFGELLSQLRMERACELLKQPSIKIYEVADRVGYRYLPYFSRQFKDKFGITPLEYRKREQ